MSKFTYQILHYLISIIKSKNISPSKNNFTFTHTSYLKACVFYQIFIFHQMTALQKQWKTFFISSKKLFSFSRYSNFCISFFPSFFSATHCLRGWSKKNLNIYDLINCLNKNSITHFVWYLEKEIRCDIETLSIDRELNKEHFMEKSCRKCSSKASPRPLFNFAT